jgi:hypothetical protein
MVHSAGEARFAPCENPTWKFRRRLLTALVVISGVCANVSCKIELHPHDGVPKAQTLTTSSAFPLQIKVVSENFHLHNRKSRTKDCDPEIFGAVCDDSRERWVQNIMQVQDSGGRTFSVTCTVKSQWSRCAPLPVGQTFPARMEKNGIMVLFRDSAGKTTKQSYKLVAPEVGALPGVPTDAMK